MAYGDRMRVFEGDGEDFVRKLRERFGGNWRGPAALVIGALLLLIGAFTSYYQVEPDEVAVMRRLGKYAGATGPGPHFKIPFGVDVVDKVPVQRQLKLEFGFRTGQSRDVLPESVMLTGDLNVAVVEWIVQFKIKDPYNFLFKLRDVEETLRDLSEAAMREVVGDHSVNEVLTTGRQKIADEAKTHLQALADRYDTGVDIQQVVLQDVNPPDRVKPSFNEVNQAIQEKERLINQAHAELNKEIPRARGEAEQAIRGAEGYAIERVNRARGDAQRFQSVYDEYQKAPDVTRRRLYLEAIAEVLPRAGQKVVFDESAKGMMPLLDMNRSGRGTAGAAASEGGAP